MQRLAQLKVALMLLTRLPVGTLCAPVPGLAASAWAFPVAGLAVGTFAAMTMAIALWLALPAAVAAGLAVATGVLLTGGLHEDGLADLADGFGGGNTRARKLEIMRDSHIGSYGTLALILAIGLRWQAIAALPDYTACAAIIAMAIASRAGLPVVMLVMPPAREDGLGRSAMGGSATGAAVAVALATLGLCLFLGLASGIGVGLAIAGAFLAVGLLARQQVGGQTGDVLGAMQQLAELAGWLTLLYFTSKGL